MLIGEKIKGYLIIFPGKSSLVNNKKRPLE